MSLPATSQVVYASGPGSAPYHSSHHSSQSLGRGPVGPPSPHTTFLPHLVHTQHQQSANGSHHSPSASVSPVHTQHPHYQNNGHNRSTGGGHGYGGSPSKNSTAHHRTNQHANANANGHALTPPPVHHLPMSSHPSQSTYSSRPYATFVQPNSGQNHPQSVYVQQTPAQPPPFPSHSAPTATSVTSAQGTQGHTNGQPEQKRLPSIKDLDIQYNAHKAQAQAQSQGQGQALNMGQGQSQNMNAVTGGGQASPTYPTPTSLYGGIPSGGSSIIGPTNGVGSVNGSGTIGRSSPPTPAPNSAYPQPYPSPAQSYIAGPSTGGGGGPRGNNGIGAVSASAAAGGPPQLPYPSSFTSPHTPHPHTSNPHSNQQSYPYPYEYDYSGASGSYTPASSSTGLPGSSGGQGGKSMTMYPPSLGPPGQTSSSTYANAPNTPSVTHGDQSWHTTHSTAHAHVSYDQPPVTHHRMTPSPTAGASYGLSASYGTRQATGSSSALAGAVGSGGIGEGGYESAQAVTAPLISPVREEMGTGTGSGVIGAAGGSVTSGETGGARAYYIPKIQELCSILCEFAKKYSSQGLQPPATELSEMARRAEHVVRLLEAYRNACISEGAQDMGTGYMSAGMSGNAGGNLSASGNVRQPKRPWEDIDEGDGEDGFVPSVYSKGKLEMGDVDDFVGVGGDSAAQKDMALIRSKRATNLNMLAAGAPKGKYRKRSRATPPGKCHSCNIRETPEWRRGPDGARTLCNACGLHYAKLCRKREKVLQNVQAQGKSSGAMVPPEIDMETLRASTRAANEREMMKKEREQERRRAGEKGQLYTGDHPVTTDSLGGGGGGSANYIVPSGEVTGSVSVPVSMSGTMGNVGNISTKVGPVQEWRT